VEGRRPVEGRVSCDACSGLSAGKHVTEAASPRIGAAWVPNTRMPITFDLRQEPGAGKPHAGICAGGGWQQPSLPRPYVSLNSRSAAVSCRRAILGVGPGTLKPIQKNSSLPQGLSGLPAAG